MRRGFASMLMGLSLLVASAGWAGLVFADSVLDENQSRQLSTHLMAHERVQAVLTTRLGDGMERYVPVTEPMSRQELQSAAAEALADPPAAAALRNRLAAAHQLGLTGADIEPTFSDSDVNEAAWLALIDARPSLRNGIRVNPAVKVQLPVEGLSWFSGLHTLTDRFTVLALALAIIGFTTSFVVASEPIPVLRRAAWWILASAAIWMAVGSLFAAIVRFTVPSSYIVFAVGMETFLRSMRNPGIVMASFGVGLLSMSYLVPAVGRRRGALLVERATEQLAADHGAVSAAAAPTVSRASVAAVGTSTGSRSTSSAKPDTSDGTHKRPDRTHGVGSRLSAAWKEGHGYLDDSRVAPFFSGSTNET